MSVGKQKLTVLFTFQIGGEKNRMGRERTQSVRPLHSGTSDAFQRCLERFPTRGSHTSCPGFHHHCYPEAGLPQRSDVIPPTHTCPQGPTQPRSLLPSRMFLLPLSPNTYCRIRTPCPNPPQQHCATRSSASQPGAAVGPSLHPDPSLNSQSSRQKDLRAV